MPSSPRDAERLAYTVRIARDEPALLQAVALRRSVMSRQLVDPRSAWGRPEPDDLHPDSTVWIAQSKHDGTPLGSMRMQTNRHRPLKLEEGVTLPKALRDQSLSDISHLAVAAGPDRMQVVMAILKANLLLLQAHRVAWSLIAARPPMTRVYREVMLYDAEIAPSGVPVPPNGGTLELLAFEVATAQARFEAAGHPAARFLFHTDHPDIQID